MTGVMCHVSGVRCHFFFGQSGGASRWRVCYQQGLPRLISTSSLLLINLPNVHSEINIYIIFLPLPALHLPPTSCCWPNKQDSTLSCPVPWINNAEQCSAVQYSEVQGISVHCTTALHCSNTLQCNTLQYNMVK